MPPLEEILLLISIVIFVPAVNLSCFKSKSPWVILPPPLDEIKLFSSIVIFVPAISLFCLFVSNSPIFVATLVDPYNNALDAVIVGAVIIELVLPVILPELIVPVDILLVEVKVDCFPFTFVSIELILFATLVPAPYN